MPVTVPSSSVTLTIATDSLKQLPTGASYGGRSGQASVSVSRQAAEAGKPEQIVVTATCDSLELLCEEYERRVAMLEASLSEASLSEASEERDRDAGSRVRAAVAGLLFGLIIGVFAGILFTSLFIIKIKK